MQTSRITETFTDGVILVTGSTGFLGKMLVEKLFRSCSLQKIVVLVRSKEGFTSDERISIMSKQPVSSYLLYYLICITKK